MSSENDSNQVIQKYRKSKQNYFRKGQVYFIDSGFSRLANLADINCIFLGIIIINTDRKGKVMFSQMFVCSQSASWPLGYCSSLLLHIWYISYWNAFLFYRQRSFKVINFLWCHNVCAKGKSGGSLLNLTELLIRKTWWSKKYKAFSGILKSQYSMILDKR